MSTVAIALYKAIYFAVLLGNTDDDVYNDLARVKASTNFSDSQGAEYLMREYEELWIRSHTDVADEIIRLTLCSIGIIGYILDLIILRGPEFKLVTFTYHRALACMELIHETGQICKSCYYVLLWTNVEYPWISYFWSTSGFINESAGYMAEKVILIMTLERLCALMLISKYHVINKKKIAWTMITICILMGLTKCQNGLSYYITTNPDGTSKWVVPSWYNWNFSVDFDFALDRISLVLNILNLASTIGVIIGLVKWGRNRARMELLDDFKISKQLTYLSLACSIPFTISTILILINDTVFNVEVLLKTASLSNKFHDIIWAQDRLIIRRYFYSFARLTWIFAHASHCYFYFCFSQLFRDGAAGLFRGKLEKDEKDATFKLFSSRP